MKVRIYGTIITILLQQKINKSDTLIFSNVNGYLLYDDEGNWLGYRVFRTQGESKARLYIPIFKVKLEHGKLIETREYIDLLFTDKKFVENIKEQRCQLEYNEDGIVRVDLSCLPDDLSKHEKWVASLLI